MATRRRLSLPLALAVRAQVREATKEQAAAAARSLAFAHLVAVVLAVLVLRSRDPVAGKIARVLRRRIVGDLWRARRRDLEDRVATLVVVLIRRGRR